MPSINGQIKTTDSGLGLVLENQHIIELEQNITNTTEQKFDKFFSHNNKQYHIQFDLKKKEKEEGDNFVIPINLLQREGEKELYDINMKNAFSLKSSKKGISVELHSFQKDKEASANRTPPRSVSSSPKNVSPRNSLSGSSSSLELNKTSTENNAKVEELEQENTNLQTKLTQAEQEKADLQTKFDAAEKEKTELQQQLDNLTKDDTAIEDLFADGSIKTEIEGLIGSTSQELEGKIKDLCDGKLRSKLKEMFYERFQKELIQFIKGGKSTGEIEKYIKEALKHFNNESKIADLQQQLKAKDEEITALKAQPDDAVTKLEGEKTTLTNKIKDLEAQLNNQMLLS
ncbi:hypothetical protein [Wolbachia endosymbiont of Dactylopius coccus]|nr:MAG: hypothetical protein TV42_00960 [Wolbachia endosymbiont of Dactylopius coccus]